VRRNWKIVHESTLKVLDEPKAGWGVGVSSCLTGGQEYQQVSIEVARGRGMDVRKPQTDTGG
jgi:hypothetical protein